MADFYVDVVNGASGNSGSQASPKQFISQATFANNNRVFLKCGQTHPIAAQKFFNNGMTLGSYGTGALPILQKTNAGDGWLYIQNVDNVTLENFIFDLNGQTGVGIAIHPSTAGHSGHVLSNLEVFGSADKIGIYIEGTLTAPVTSVLIKNCIAHGNGYHGMQCVGQVSGCLFDSCIAYGNGLAVAGHGFSTYAPTASPNPSGIVFKNCVAYGTIDFNGQEGQGFQFDNNSTNCSFIGCLSYNNQGAGFVFNAGSSHRAIGNIAYGNYKPGLLCQATTGSLIANNTFVGNCRSTAYTAEIVLQTTATGATINNNILAGSDSKNPTGISVDAGSASGSAAATNCIYGFTTASSGITPSGTVTSDPLLGSGYRLNSSSPCVGAGTVTVSLSDYYSKEFKSPPDIGAVNYYPARSVTTRNIRGKTALVG